MIITSSGQSLLLIMRGTTAFLFAIYAILDSFTSIHSAKYDSLTFHITKLEPYRQLKVYMKASKTDLFMQI